LYEKILSRQRKPSTWTLKPEFPCPLVSSRPLTRTTKQHALRPKSAFTRRFNSPSLNTSQPDGRVNTLLSRNTPTQLLLAANTALKKRSVSRVRKNVTAVPVPASLNAS
jgi:hypothetical protein